MKTKTNLPLALVEATKEPITVERARELLATYGVAFKFITRMHPTALPRLARISKDTGIIYEGVSL